MRRNSILALLGRLLFFLGLAMFLPLFWSIISNGPDLQAFIISSFVTCLTGFILLWKKPLPDNLSIKEGFTFVTLAWVASALFGSLPYLLAGTFHSFADAFFESMSGFTTTGATVIDNIEILPGGILLWRSFTQWLGGMGIIALFMVLIPRLGLKGGFHLLRAEIPGPGPERVVPRIAETAKMLWIIYIVLSCLEAVLLILTGFSFFDALNHAFTTMPTGGFSTRNASIGGFTNPFAEVVIIAFMFLAGGNFALYFSFWRGQRRAFVKDEEFKFYLIVIFLATGLVLLNIYPQTYYSFSESLRKGAFQVVSILTTTGYATADFDLWPPLSRGILLTLMFFGGSGGSTGGAMKQIRILIIIKYSYRELQKIIHPKAVIPLRLGGNPISEETVRTVIGFSFFYIIIFALNTLIMAALGLDLISSFSITAATLGNVGPGLGLVGPTETYANIPLAGKLLLPFIMLIGRLEIYTVLIFLLPEIRSASFKIKLKNSNKS